MSAQIDTIVIDNWAGRLTRFNNGQLNSGFAKYSKTFGNDAFSSPGQLTWLESPTRIDSGGTVITDLIVAAKPRLENGITYVYAIGSAGRLYKIQVNDPTSYNPNYDNPVLLTTLTAQSPTFKYGASLVFYGSTAQIYIGHDVGVTRINFDGTGETFIGTASSYTANVPRPGIAFRSSIYFGNGLNIAEISTTGTVTSYSKLNVNFPTGTQVRDLGVSPEGNIMLMTVSRVTAPDMTVSTQDTSSLSSGDSYIFQWNGADLGYTAFTTFNAFSTNSTLTFSGNSFTMGYDLGSVAVYSQGQKLLTLNNSLSPNFNAKFSTGNMMGIMSPEKDGNVLKSSIFVFGQYDREVPEGVFRLLKQSATTQTDIIQVPVCLIVSNLLYGSSSAGYANNIVGAAKIYFSTLETDNVPTKSYKFYKFSTVPTGAGTAIGGVYETQTQLFSKKIKISEVRIYAEPFVANNSFKIDLIGTDGNVIANSSETFTVGTNLTSGDDFAWYTPQIKPTYALGVRITNLGSVNWTCNKIEVDTYPAGK